MTESESTIMIDIPCRACRYNVRGLQVSGRCPECGQDIANSVAVFKLGGVELRWFQALRLGIAILIGAVILGRLVPIFVYTLFNWFKVASDSVLHRALVTSMDGLVLFTILCGWWSMHLLTEESHPVDEQNRSRTSEHRLRCAANTYTVFRLIQFFIIFFGMLFLWPMFPDIAVNISKVINPILAVLNALFIAWVYWAVLGRIGNIAELVRRPSLVGQTLFLRKLFVFLYAAGLVWEFLRKASSQFLLENMTMQSLTFLYGCIGISLHLPFLMAFIWAVVILVIVYRELGAFRSTAAATAEGVRPFWIPEAVTSILQWLRMMWGLRSYRGDR